MRRVRLAIELAGEAAFVYGGFLLAPWLGWLLAGAFLLLMSYNIGHQIEIEKRDKAAAADRPEGR